jgi:catechol 2,3-dioxygenase-like lactoylglutathione lyase family enzyme
MVQLDHTIVHVNDLDATVAFWTRYLGVFDEGFAEPFRVLRVAPELTIQLAPWGTEGNAHYAFALPPAEFDASLERLRADGVPFGDSFHSAENGQGPGEESGARGVARTIYFFDPNRHLLEIRAYDE